MIGLSHYDSEEALLDWYKRFANTMPGVVPPDQVPENTDGLLSIERSEDGRFTVWRKNLFGPIVKDEELDAFELLEQLDWVVESGEFYDVLTELNWEEAAWDLYADEKLQHHCSEFLGAQTNFLEGLEEFSFTRSSNDGWTLYRIGQPESTCYSREEWDPSNYTLSWTFDSVADLLDALLDAGFSLEHLEQLLVNDASDGVLLVEEIQRRLTAETTRREG